MKVILLEDIKGKGKKGEIKDLPNGFANFLIKQKKVMEASQKNMKVLKQQEVKAKEEQQLKLEEAKALKLEIEQKTVIVKVKAGNNGRVFGSVSTKLIVDEFEKQFKIKLDKRKMNLENPIRNLGMVRIETSLHPEVTAIVTVQVKAED